MAEFDKILETAPSGGGDAECHFESEIRRLEAIIRVVSTSANVLPFEAVSEYCRRMVLRQASPERLVVMRRSSMKAPWFIALSLGLMGTTPLLSGGVPTLSRIVASALLFLAASALFAYSRPRSVVTTADLAKKLITAKDGAPIALERAQAFVLGAGGHSHEDDAPRNRYRVELLLDDGRSLPWLERSDPAGVLADLRSALRYLPLPVQSGWGLPKGAEPWRPDQPVTSEGRASVLDVRGRPHQYELGAGICAVGGALVIGTVITLSHGSRLERGDEISMLSWALSGTLFAIVSVIAAFLLSDRVRVTSDERTLAVERRALGMSLGQRAIPLPNVQGAYAVGPDPATPLHVLVCQKDEISSIPLVGEAARVVARAFTTEASSVIDA